MSQQFKTTTTTTTKKTERHCAEWKKEPMSKKKITYYMTLAFSK